MKKYLHLIQDTKLFTGIEKEDIEVMLDCLSAQIKTYRKDQFIFRSGDIISTVGMVLVGSVHIVQEDFWGNTNLITKVLKGQLFGETYACVDKSPLGVHVISAEPSEVMYLDIHKLMTVCTSACKFHTQLVQNLLFDLAKKNLMLTKKMELMTKRTTREKLLSYLSTESLKRGHATFEIPYNRQQLADYLSVDRSAMSNELCKLRDEGVLSFQKNKFCLMHN